MLAAPSGTGVPPGTPGRRDVGGNRATPSRAWILGGFALTRWSQTRSATRSIGAHLLQRARTMYYTSMQADQDPNSGNSPSSQKRDPGPERLALGYRRSQCLIHIASFCSSCGDQRPVPTHPSRRDSPTYDALHLNITSPVFSRCATASLLRHWEYGVVLERNLGPAAVQTGTQEIDSRPTRQSGNSQDLCRILLAMNSRPSHCRPTCTHDLKTWVSAARGRMRC